MNGKSCTHTGPRKVNSIDGANVVGVVVDEGGGEVVEVVVVEVVVVVVPSLGIVDVVVVDDVVVVGLTVVVVVWCVVVVAQVLSWKSGLGHCVVVVGLMVVVVVVACVVVVVPGLGGGHAERGGLGWPTSKAITTLRPWASANSLPTITGLMGMALTLTLIGFCPVCSRSFWPGLSTYLQTKTLFDGYEDDEGGALVCRMVPQPANRTMPTEAAQTARTGREPSPSLSVRPDIVEVPQVRDMDLVGTVGAVEPGAILVVLPQSDRTFAVRAEGPHGHRRWGLKAKFSRTS
jgi:hypothetical protein